MATNINEKGINMRGNYRKSLGSRNAASARQAWPVQ